ncbi:MAG: alpha/beta fold hydrolase [Acidimicrobiales bacterium]
MLKSFLEGELFGSVYGGQPIEVVALHGWGRDHGDFSKLGASWLGKCGIMAPDLPGFGAAPAPPSAWGSAEYAGLISRLVENEIGTPVVVLGHSFGGRVAVRLAASRPELVKSLVLTGVPLAKPQYTGQRKKGPRVAFAYRVARRLEKLGLVPQDRMESMRKRYGSPDYARASGMMRAVLVKVLAETYSDDLARLACPVYLVWGEEDAEVPAEVARMIAEAVPGARLTVLAGIGHLVPTIAPDALKEALESALLVGRS